MPAANQLIIALVAVVCGSLIFGGRGGAAQRSIRRYFWDDSAATANDGAHLFLSTSFSMNGILYQTFLGYAVGIASLWAQVIWCLSYLWMASYVTKISRLSRKGTLHGAITDSYGTRAGRVAAVATIIGFTTQVGWELAVGLSVFKGTLPTSRSLFLLVTVCLAIVAAVYTLLGGLRGNLAANRLQNRLAGLGLFAALVMLIVTQPAVATTQPSFIGSHTQLLVTLGWVGLFANVVFSLLWQFVDMSAWQTMAATIDDEQTPRRTLLKSALWVFIFPGVIGTLLGMYLRGIPGLDANTIIPALVALVTKHMELGIFVIAGFIAAMLSTIDGLLLAAGQALTWDLLDRPLVKRLLQPSNGTASTGVVQPSGVNDVQGEQHVIKHAQVAVLVFALLGAAGVFLLVDRGVDLFALVYVVTVAQMSLVPTVMMMLHVDTPARSGSASIAAGLILGFGAALYGILHPSPTSLEWSPIIAVGAALVGLVCFRASTKGVEA